MEKVKKSDLDRLEQDFQKELESLLNKYNDKLPIKDRMCLFYKIEHFIMDDKITVALYKCTSNFELLDEEGRRIFQ